MLNYVKSKKVHESFLFVHVEGEVVEVTDIRISLRIFSMLEVSDDGIIDRIKF